jgi:hypothetical protein
MGAAIDRVVEFDLDDDLTIESAVHHGAAAESANEPIGM